MAFDHQEAENGLSRREGLDTEHQSGLAAWLQSEDTDRDAFMEKEYQRGLALMEKDDPALVQMGYAILKPVAKMGHVGAMLVAGHYEETREQLEMAAKWFKQAAEEGSPEGHRCYAEMLITGRGLEQNPKEAFKHYETAAKGGVPEAMYVMGELHRKQDQISPTITWYHQAQKAGFAPANDRLEQLALPGQEQAYTFAYNLKAMRDLGMDPEAYQQHKMKEANHTQPGPFPLWLVLLSAGLLVLQVVLYLTLPFFRRLDVILLYAFLAYLLPSLIWRNSEPYQDAQYRKSLAKDKIPLIYEQLKAYTQAGLALEEAQPGELP